MFLVATQSGAGAERAKKLNKRERDMKKYGRAGPEGRRAGAQRRERGVSGDRIFFTAPAPLTCSADCQRQDTPNA